MQQLYGIQISGLKWLSENSNWVSSIVELLYIFFFISLHGVNETNLELKPLRHTGRSHHNLQVIKHRTPMRPICTKFESMIV